MPPLVHLLIHFNLLLRHPQSTGLVRHVFRLLKDAKDNSRAVPWVLLENVSDTTALLRAVLRCDMCSVIHQAVQFWRRVLLAAFDPQLIS
jgi:hypothetical protein